MARLTKEQIAEIHALRSKSISYRKIAIRLGISIDTVKAHCRRHKIVPIHPSGTHVDEKKKAVGSSQTYKRWKPVSSLLIFDVNSLPARLASLLVLDVNGCLLEQGVTFVYCALKYSGNIDKTLIAAVNHNGDSESTGAITGNIIGAQVGLSGIPAKYTEKLELRDLIIEVADDLWHDCRISEYGSERDPVWEQKYIEMTYGKRP